MGILDNPSIESLNLDGNEIDGTAMTALCMVLLGPPNSKLKRLSLHNNSFGDDGARALEQIIFNIFV
jgi:hypothetical protein